MAIGSAVAWALTSVAMRPIASRALWRSSLLRMLMCAALLLGERVSQRVALGIAASVVGTILLVV
jgi:drug/metabolite transporter (DMT)-like permease